MRTLIFSAAALALFAAPSGAQDSETPNPAKDEIVNRLATQLVTVDFKDVTFEEAIAFIRDTSGLNIVIDAEASSQVAEGQSRVTLKVKDVILKSVLRLMLDPRDLTGVFKEGVLVIMPKGKAVSSMTIQMYDVRDMFMLIADFPGPVVELVTPNNDVMTGIQVTFEPPREVLINTDLLTELVRTCTGGDSWEENPNASLSMANGMLVVAQSRRVHQEIRRFLQLLRQFK